MRNVKSGQMASKQYCPECGSFSIKRTHRGYISKLILNTSPQYKCGECGVQTSENVLAENRAKKMPMFIDSGYPSSTAPY